MSHTKNRTQKNRVSTPALKAKIEQLRRRVVSVVAYEKNARDTRPSRKKLWSEEKILNSALTILRRDYSMYEPDEEIARLTYPPAIQGLMQAVRFRQQLREAAANGGRPTHFYLREAAYELGELFRQESRDHQPHWDLVSAYLVEWFPEVKRDEQHPRQGADWAEKLEREYLKLRRDENAWKRALASLVVNRIPPYPDIDIQVVKRPTTKLSLKKLPPQP